ncbi:MAG: transcription initiation factor IIB family protein [Sulfolobales archaeon]
MSASADSGGETIEIIYDPVRGEYINLLTGEVVYDSETISGKDWRAYSAEEHLTRARTGSGLTFKVHDGGITTFIEGDNKYSNLQRRLRRTGDTSVRREIEAKKILNEIAGILNLPEVLVEDAGILIKKAVNKNLIKRKNIEAVVGAIIYRVAFIRKIDLDKDQLLKILGVSKKKLFKTLKRLEWENLFDEFRERVSKHARDRRGGSMCGGSGMFVLLERLEVSENVKRLASNIIESLSRVNPSICSGKNPRGLLGAVVYIASIISSEKISQQEIARRLGVSEVTIRNRYKNILDEVDIVVFI